MLSVDQQPERQLLSPLLLPLHLTILLISLILPPFRHRATIFIPILIATYVPLALSPMSVAPAESYGATAVWVYTFRVISLLLFTVPEHVFFRPSQEAARSPASYTLVKKAGWVLSLLSTARGVGWNYSTHTVPSPGWQSRRSFVARSLLRIIKAYLVIDLGRTYSVLQPYAMFEPGEPGFMLPSDSRRQVWQRVSDMASMIMMGSGFMQISYLVISVIAVGIFGSEPTAWPRLFGSPKDAWSVKRLWGSKWSLERYEGKCLSY